MSYYAKKKTATWGDIQEHQKTNNLEKLIKHPVITAALELHKLIADAMSSDKYDQKFASWWDQTYRSSLSISTNFSEYLAKSYSLPYRISVGEVYETLTSCRACPVKDDEFQNKLLLACKKVIDLLNYEVEQLTKTPNWSEVE